MSNSPLVGYTQISPNSTNPRKDSIKKITIHHMAGNLSVENCGKVFAPASRQASANYGIGTDGRVGMYVEEKNRAWTSSNAANDNQAVTIEVANDKTGGDWHVSDVALAKLVDLCTDICRRNGIQKLVYTNDAAGNLTRHNMFAATDCPGPYLQSQFPYVAEEVNKRLNPPPPALLSYVVRITANELNIRTGPGTGFSANGSIKDKGVYTIVEEAEGPGAKKWGKLKSGLGWISLDYTTRV
ncbi:MAG: N-acetylmuramoyl-L-alanine amidase [Cystobacterineae bacterium]|nr:N-acetylmuramoyl-L-alanine amidase [Cystobacterineae bacterium]